MGPMKRYSAEKDRKTYYAVVIAAKWIYDCMVSHQDDVARCTMRYLKSAQPTTEIAMDKICWWLSNFICILKTSRLL